MPECAAPEILKVNLINIGQRCLPSQQGSQIPQMSGMDNCQDFIGRHQHGISARDDQPPLRITAAKTFYSGKSSPRIALLPGRFLQLFPYRLRNSSAGIHISTR